PRVFGILRRLEIQRRGLRARYRSLQETFIDVTDLLNVEPAIGQRAAAKDLDSVQDQQNSAVVDWQRRAQRIGPRRSSGTTFKKGISIRVEEGAAERRRTHRLMIHPCIYDAKGRQQSRPGIFAPFEDFVAFSL